MSTQNKSIGYKARNGKGADRKMKKAQGKLPWASFELNRGLRY